MTTKKEIEMLKEILSDVICCRPMFTKDMTDKQLEYLFGKKKVKSIRKDNRKIKEERDRAERELRAQNIKRKAQAPWWPL